VAEAPTDATTAEDLLAYADADLFAGRRRTRAIGTAVEVDVDLVAEEAATPVEANGRGRLVLDEVLTAAEGRSFSAQVRLRRGDEVYIGRASGSRAAAAASRIVATATLDAVAGMDPRWAETYLVSVGVVPTGEADVALVHLVLAEGSFEESAVGAAAVRQERRDVAVASALLDALNRRLTVQAAGATTA
jgi:hypothetical protein